MSTVYQVGLLLILAALAGYAIPALIQVRRTARALEDLVRDASPRLVGATSSLDSVLGRTDRVMQGLETGTRGLTGAIAGLGSFLGGLRPPARGLNRGPATMAALASFLTGAWQAWAAYAPPQGRGKPEGAAPPGVRAEKKPSSNPPPSNGDPTDVR